MSATAYIRELSAEEVTFLESWLRGRTLRNGMPTLDWLEATFERLARGRSARREPTLSHLELWNRFANRLGPMAANSTPDRDAWEQMMEGLRERDRAHRAEEREARLQARQKGETPALLPDGPEPAEPERKATDAEWEQSYARIRAHHLERKALRKAAVSMTAEARFFATEWEPDLRLWPRPELSALKQHRRRWYD